MASDVNAIVQVGIAAPVCQSADCLPPTYERAALNPSAWRDMPIGILTPCKIHHNTAILAC